jgi:hypothetical protein
MVFKKGTAKCIKYGSQNLSVAGAGVRHEAQQADEKALVLELLVVGPCVFHG